MFSTSLEEICFVKNTSQQLLRVCVCIMNFFLGGMLCYRHNAAYQQPCFFPFGNGKAVIVSAKQRSVWVSHWLWTLDFLRVLSCLQTPHNLSLSSTKIKKTRLLVKGHEHNICVTTCYNVLRVLLCIHGFCNVKANVSTYFLLKYKGSGCNLEVIFVIKATRTGSHPFRLSVTLTFILLSSSSSFNIFYHPQHYKTEKWDCQDFIFFLYKRQPKLVKIRKYDIILKLTNKRSKNH